MTTQSYAPYRGCQIEVHVTPARTHVIGGMAKRFRVSWTVSSPGQLNSDVASFPEQFNFLSEQEAFRYGENRAHTFIDSILRAPSDGAALGGSFASREESRDDTRRL